jgi:hypothetical protein
MLCNILDGTSNTAGYCEIVVSIGESADTYHISQPAVVSCPDHGDGYPDRDGPGQPANRLHELQGDRSLADSSPTHRWLVTAEGASRQSDGRNDVPQPSQRKAFALPPYGVSDR